MNTFLQKASRGLFRTKAAMSLFLVLLASVAASAATDFSTLTAGVDTDIASIGTVLMGIGAAIIGIALVVFVYRFIRGVLH